jgi:CP family cyanate transporter-like MFS transporter
LALIFLVGVDLRVVMLAVPPVIPAIHRDLSLDEKGIAALSSLPVLVLALAAVPGSLLIARLGARRALLAGLVVVTFAGAARGLIPLAALLFGMTLLMGIGIAVSQPASPSVVKDWFPAHVGLATAMYANGVLVGEILPVTLAPWILTAVRESWGLSLALWSLPVLFTVAAIVLLTRGHGPAAGEPLAPWWPDWRSWRTWQAGLLLGCMSALYWSANAFLPDLLHTSGRPNLVTPALAVLNAAQLPTSILITLAPSRFVGHRWPFLLGGGTVALAVPAMVLMPGAWVVFWAAVLGAVSGLVFVCALALPPLLSAPQDVARLSAAMFTITYTLSFTGPLLGGAAWDVTGVPLSAFVPASLGGLAMIALAARLHLGPAPDRSSRQATAAHLSGNRPG